MRYFVLALFLFSMSCAGVQNAASVTKKMLLMDANRTDIATITVNDTECRLAMSDSYPNGVVFLLYKCDKQFVKVVVVP
jgi:hypothetical protein